MFLNPRGQGAYDLDQESRNGNTQANQFQGLITPFLQYYFSITVGHGNDSTQFVNLATFAAY